MTVSGPNDAASIGPRPVVGDPLNKMTPMRSGYARATAKIGEADVPWEQPKGVIKNLAVWGGGRNVSVRVKCTLNGTADASGVTEAQQAFGIIEGQQKSFVFTLQNLSMATNYSCKAEVSSLNIDVALDFDAELSSGPADFYVPFYEEGSIPEAGAPPAAAEDPAAPTGPTDDGTSTGGGDSGPVEGKQPPVCGMKFSELEPPGEISINMNSNTTWPLVTALSLDFWIVPINAPANGTRLLEIGADSNSTDVVFAEFLDLSNALAITIGALDSQGARQAVTLFENSTKTVKLSEWNHVHIAISGLDQTLATVRGFVDGVLFDEKTQDMRALPAALARGTRGYLGGNNYGGEALLSNTLFSEVRIRRDGLQPLFDKCILSQFRMWSEDMSSNATQLFLRGPRFRIPDTSPLLLWYRLNEPDALVTAEDHAGNGRSGILSPMASFSCKPPLIESTKVDVQRYEATIELNVVNAATWTGFIYLNATCSAASLPEGIQLPPSTQVFGPSPFLLPPRKVVPIPVKKAALPPNSQFNCTVFINMNDGPEVKVVAQTELQFQTGPVPPAPPLPPPPPKLMYYSANSLLVQIMMQQELAWPPIVKCDLYVMSGGVIVGRAEATELETRWGRLVSVRGLDPTSNYTFFSRCWNKLEAGPVSRRVTFMTDGPPQEPFAAVRFAVSFDTNTQLASMEIGIPRPIIAPYFEVPPGTFNCSITVIEFNGQPILGMGPTVKLEDFGDQRILRRTMDSFMVGTRKQNVGVGRYKIAISCANQFGRRDGGWIPIDIFNLEPPPSPGFTLVPRTFGANLWVDTLYLIPPGLEFCAGYVNDAEVFRVTKADDMWCYRPFRSADVETCGAKAVKNGGIPATISTLLPGTTYTLEVACSNANGRGQSQKKTFTTKDLPPPKNLVIKKAESQYVTVYFDMQYGQGGDPVTRCHLLIDGQNAGTLNFTAAMGQPNNVTMSSSISVLELKPDTAYSVRAACGRQEGLSNYTDPVAFKTRVSAVAISPKSVGNIISNLAGASF
eukprot:tig00000826_g4596.t1